jgi:AbrB family looped-hinge helix DNA binding protein
MNTKIVKVSDKGQISIPISMRKSTGIDKGDELLVIKSGRAIIIEKIKKSDFTDLLKNSECVAKKLWDNPENEVWNNV